MKPLSVVSVIATAMGCVSSGTGSRAPLSSEPIAGTYEYVANLPTQQVRGTMRVIADTILVDPLSDYCRPFIGPPDPLAIKYTCTGTGTYEQVQLSIDRRSPMQLSRWSAVYRVQRRRNVCIQYAVRDGRQVCVQTTSETYETTESRSGTLQVRRTSGAG